MAYSIIATDSRGRGLPNSTANQAIIVKPGATLEKLVEDINLTITQNTQENQNICVTIAAGICNLTTKINNTNGTEVVYFSSQENVDQVISFIKDTYESMNSDSVSLRLAHIPPVSLLKSEDFNILKKRLEYSSYSTEQKLIQQQELEADISRINYAISNLNLQYDKVSLRWDRDVTKSGRKKRGRNGKVKYVCKFDASHLYDGVHPDTVLKQTWFSKLLKSVQSELSERLEFSDSESEDSESWDFKRAKRD